MMIFVLLYFFWFFPGLTQFKENYRKITFLRAFERYNSYANIAPLVLGLIKKASLNDCFWIIFLRWERRSSWCFSMAVHACDNAEENIGKTTYFNQDFPWHYLNGGPTQRKRNSTIALSVKNWSRNSHLNSLSWWAPKSETAMASRKKWRSSFCLIFSVFSGIAQFKKNYRKISFSRAFEPCNSCVNLIFDPENHPLWAGPPWSARRVSDGIASCFSTQIVHDVCLLYTSPSPRD